MTSLAILGASGHGKVLADIALLSGWNKITFFDDFYPKIKAIEGWTIAGNTDDLLMSLNNFNGCIVGIGDNEIRLEKTELLLSNSAKLISLIHPSSVISEFSEVDVGSAIMAGAIINPFSKIGLACIVNTAATIDHDSVISDGSHIGPGVNMAGNVSIGKKSFIGIGASVKQGVDIGDNVILGAGSVLIQSLNNNALAAGAPAKVINSQE